ncbi:MAG: tRNA (adenosine(37)-N6)-threonylcarbamoyltransferase complex ATPase subunit type 1 TsaE [Alphaproteobacteria bacterium]
MLEFQTSSEAETKTLAAKLAKALKPGDCVAFFATLGMGKSVFCRTIIQTLMPEVSNVPSPTFTLVQTYDNEETEIWHFDLYRLEEPEEVFELGIDEALQNSITLIEWPQNMGTYLPSGAIKIYITPGENPDDRLIKIESDKKLLINP